MKKVLCAIGVALAMILLVCAGIIGYLTVDEYSPRPVETLEVEGEGHKTVPKDSTIRVMSWNLGYGALGDNADFFMDGGKMVYSAIGMLIGTFLICMGLMALQNAAG